MIDTYGRGNVTLTVDYRIGVDQVTFTIARTAALTDDEVARVNAELVDYPAAHGAQLIQLPNTSEWQVRRGATVLATDRGDCTAELRWEAQL